MASLSRRPLPILPLILAWVIAGAPGARSQAPAPSPVLVESDGALLVWDGMATELAPAPGDLDSGIAGARRVVPCGAGRALLLEPAAATPGKERGRNGREGEAVLVDFGGPAPRRGAPIAFEGLPIAGAVAGGRAFIVTWRGDAGAPSGKGWLHAVDLEKGAVLESTLLSARPLDVVLDPGAGRLFVAYPDRIQTYATAPLRVSWQYRSPGPNGPLAVLAGGGIVAAARGAEVALFAAETIETRQAEERHRLADDATAVVTLPFAARRLAASADGRLLLATGPAGLAFIDPGSASARAPENPPADLGRAAGVAPLAFPGPERDLIVALLPAGAIFPIRAPEAAPPSPPAPAASEVAAATVAAADTATVAPAAGPELPPQPAPAPASAAPEPEAEPESAPVPSAIPESGLAPALSGRIGGKRDQVRAVVLYGPNNILKEFGRAPVDAEGRWIAPLPPPGTYRLVAIGDGSTPIPVAPSFRTVTVAGAAQADLDFEVR